MNVKLHHVLSDITGLSGLAINRRDPRRRARSKNIVWIARRRVKASEETIIQALTGDHRPERILTLKQSLAAYRNCQKLISDCDRAIEARLKDFEGRILDQDANPLPPSAARSCSAMNRVSICEVTSTGFSVWI
jgi:hypothetical protein